MNGQPLFSPETAERAFRLDPDGLPILEEVVEHLPSTEQISASIKAQLLEELEPRLQGMVASAFTAAIKSIALDLKHSFEAHLDETLEARLETMIADAVEKACEETLNE